MLTISNLYAYYGSITALHGINMEICKGKITCLIGSNGAGKSTLLKAISGQVKRSGSICFNGTTELITMSPQAVAKLHICHVPEGRHIFPGLTVRQNLEVGTINWHGFFGKADYSAQLEEVFTLFPRLREREKQMGWSLSGGEQQMLAIGRGLMSKPEILMMDEPSMGLSPVITAELFDKIREINETGMTILLVEQNARLAMKTSHYTYVLEQGNIKLSGKSEDIRNEPQVLKAYLGKFAHAQEL